MIQAEINPCAQTATGLLVDLAVPDPSLIRIEDIAAALSRTCRFGGHLKAGVPFYSVAQHSVLVAEICPREFALQGLLHDAAEAYLGDMITPLKALLPGYVEIERRWLAAIGAVFGVNLVDKPPVVVEADARAMATERRDLMERSAWRPGGAPLAIQITALPPAWAHDAFLAKYDRLARG